MAGMLRLRPFLLTIVLALVTLPPLLAGPAPVEAQGRPATRVYVLRGGDELSDQAVIQALSDRGFTVTRGVPTPSFDGTQADLTDFDVVLPLYTANWTRSIPAAGVAALRAYVEGGGSLVTGEWFSWRGPLSALMPITNCGSNTAVQTTYTRRTVNPIVSAGLPISFTFSLSNISGSETCMEARPEATVLYGSSNGGGGGDRVGLAAWGVGAGRVASFSTIFGTAELQSAEYRTLLQNVVAWLSESRDASPPVVRELSVQAAGGFAPGRDVRVEIRANDSGGSGISTYFISEYVYSGDPSAAWRVVRVSGWQRYRPPGATLTWTLSDTPGVHYLRVFVSDRAGNISREPGVALVNYHPDSPVSLGTDEIQIYRVAPGAGQRVQVTMNAVGAGANPDLYVFGPGVTFNPESDAPEERATFEAQAGVYQIEVVGHQAGSYTLSYSIGPTRADQAAGDGPAIERRGRGSPINLLPEQPTGGPGDLPAPPVGAEQLVFVPYISR